jgi:hypothetical protein
MSAFSAMCSYFFTASRAARMSSNCEMSAPEANAFGPWPEKTTMRISSSFSPGRGARHGLPHVHEIALCLATLLKLKCSTEPSTQALRRSVGDW